MKNDIIAVCGKGGVGKTSISALLVKALCSDREKRVLAIDADPAVGLATSLGFSVNRSVDMIRNDLIHKLERKTAGDASQMSEMLDYELLDALEERDNIAFLAIGRPEKEGCYCQVNAALRDLIGDLSRNFDYVVIDGEAGIEQVNRRVMESVTSLVLVSDLSRKGLAVAGSIAEVADTAMHCERKGLIINRLQPDDIIDLPSDWPVELVGTLPEDPQIRQADMRGDNLLALDDSPASRQLLTFLPSILGA